ncbi:MAG: HlyC/CorC family transporter [Chloroflexi bacterium]|nr:HlyC/CorC family transporter [Chloroflexota bacterium]
MDEGSLSGLITLVGLVGLNGLITLAYAALTNSREYRLREQAEAGKDIPPELHITYQLSQVITQFSIAAVAASTLAQPLVTQLGIANPNAARAAAYVITLIPTALLALVLGNLVPEAIGSARADRLAPWLKPPMRLLIVLLSPLVKLIILLSRALASIFGSGGLVNVFTEEEIMTLLDAGEKEGTIENQEKQMIYSVLEFDETLAREVMVPRIDVIAVEIETPLEEALQLFIQSGHSRIPVYEDNIDNVKGLLYAKDLLSLWPSGGTKSIREIMRTAFFVPESKRCDVLLKEMRANKIHMAVVVDEYGGTAGLLTIEDLIEEIVGDIQDEYDVNEEADYIQKGPDEYIVDASINLDDFNELMEVELSTEDSDTLGGFVFTQLGHVPEVGETVDHPSFTLRVDSIEGRRIRKVHIVRKRQEPPPNDAETGNSGHAPLHAQPVTTD